MSSHVGTHCSIAATMNEYMRQACNVEHEVAIAAVVEIKCPKLTPIAEHTAAESPYF
ncbi:MAG: hypothetical protein RSD88_07770 [Anaerovoracaceae bacterium]